MNNDTILLLTPRQASKALNVCERTLYGLSKSGKLPVVHIGRAVRYSVDDIRAWIDRTKKTSENSQKGA
jgi:excisionase family DNA binding protein